MSSHMAQIFAFMNYMCHFENTMTLILKKIGRHKKHEQSQCLVTQKKELCTFPEHQGELCTLLEQDTQGCAKVLA